MTIDRRKALSLLALTSAAPLSVSAREAAHHSGAVSFHHGVASGDPHTDSVLLWTRVTPADAAKAGDIPVAWEVASDGGFKHVVSHGVIRTHADRDFTVKAVAEGLKAGTEYFYRFRAGKAVTPIGRTRTLPEGPVKDAVIAFVTCALWPGGYFNAYDHLAKLDRVDAIVELGDYYYEYGAKSDDYGMNIGKKLNRIPDPPHDIVTLADYRTRHALYKGDPDLQAAHARAPWICVWDDHETANDSWAGGAENHNPQTEGPWITREQAALKAYYEWMPIREPEPGRAFEAINRSFQFGDLATLIMVETRLVARSRQLEYDRDGDIPLAVYDSADPAKRERVTDPAKIAMVMAAAKAGQPPPAPYLVGPDVKALDDLINDPERQMLGARQEEWLKLEVANSVSSGRPWQILGNQVVMARVQAPDIQHAMGGPEKVAAFAEKLQPAVAQRLTRYATYFSFDIPMDLDGWDGYAAARERMYDAIRASNANAVIVSGDSHAAWVNQLHDASGAVVAAEFGVTSVTSPSVGEAVPFLDVAKLIMEKNKEVLFNDQKSHGYTRLTITRDAVVGEHVTVEKLAKPYTASTLATYRVSPADGPGIGAIERLG